MKKRYSPSFLFLGIIPLASANGSRTTVTAVQQQPTSHADPANGTLKIVVCPASIIPVLYSATASSKSTRLRAS